MNRYSSAQLLEVGMILYSLKNMSQQYGVSFCVVASDRGEPSGQALRYVVQRVSKPREIWPESLEDIHCIDKLDLTRKGWVVAHML